MKRRLFLFAVVLMLLASVVFASGCSGKMNMITGRWKLLTAGDEHGENQQQYPLPVVVDIYPDGRVDMLDSAFGKYKMDRDTFTFVSDDGTMKESGSYKVDYHAVDEATDETIPTLTIYLDDQPASYVFQKQVDLSGLLAYKKAKAAATPTPAAPAATPAATPAPTASSAQ